MGVSLYFPRLPQVQASFGQLIRPSLFLYETVAGAELTGAGRGGAQLSAQVCVTLVILSLWACDPTREHASVMIRGQHNEPRVTATLKPSNRPDYSATN